MSRQHGKYASSTLRSRDRTEEGTAARTRPFSFEEIMTRRKKKDLSQVTKEESVPRVGLRSEIEVVENYAPHKSEGTDKYSRLLSSHIEKQVLEEHSRMASRSEEELPRRGGRPARGSHDGRNHVEDSSKVKSRNRDEHSSMKENAPDRGRDKKIGESEAELRTGPGSELRSKVDKGERDKKNHSRSKHDGWPWNDAEDRRLSSEVRIKGNRGETDRTLDTRSRNRNDQRHRNEQQDRAGKDYIRDSVATDRYADRGGGKSDRESKRKHHDADDAKIKDRSASKKLDLGRSHDLEISERKERKELFGSRYDESRMEKKRSRSREREKDRDRKSSSLSPKAPKHKSSGGRNHGELSSQSDRSGKQHKDAEKSKFPSNGSGSNYRGHGGSTSGLGGYSPRKRKTENAVKTPSPTIRSPERKNAGWDIPPTGNRETLSVSFSHGSQVSNPSVSTNVQELVSAVTAALNTSKPPMGASTFLPAKNNASIDSIQLTESTRPMRRLYVENVPTSASEKSLMEYLNHYLLFSGVNHIQGTQPCISCIIHKEKCQALVEFLTPEDASAALSSDGSFFSGSILKVRRPKDFVEVAITNSETVEEAKSAATPSVINDIVIDSPHKVFIGGISEVLSAEMLLEIVRAFGPVKAFHFEAKESSTDRYAFLEYVDHSVTSKACAGLNGMKLGSQVLTVVQAVPNSSSTSEHIQEHTGAASLYAIPDHAKPLLARPTPVLKLKNVFTSDDLHSLSQTEVEEVLEDIRLECARFGTVKSVNVIPRSAIPVCNSEAPEFIADGASVKTRQNIETSENNGESSLEAINYEDDARKVKLIVNTSERKDGEGMVESEGIDVEEHINDVNKDYVLQQPVSKVEENDSNIEDLSDSDIPENSHQLNVSNDHLGSPGNEDTEITQVEDVHAVEQPLDQEEFKLDENNCNFGEALDLGTAQNEETEGQISDFDQVFEPGSVFVEYKRSEGSCMAAHCLHGRLFDERVVTVEYVPLDVYRIKFLR